MVKVWLNGEILNAEDAHLSIHERGFLLGEAAFETMCWRDGAIRRWWRHLARLKSGLAYLGVSVPELDDLDRAAGILTLANQLSDEEAIVRLTVGGGASSILGVPRPDGVKATVLITTRPHQSPSNHIQLAVLDGPRRAALPSNRYKLAAYADHIAARREAAARGADMALMLGAEGQPVCCDIANLFWVDGSGTIVTPPVGAGALPGTTRAALLEAAPRAGLKIVEASRDTARFDDALAACVTNAVMGAVPVASVDGRMLDTANPVLNALIKLEKKAL